MCCLFGLMDYNHSLTSAQKTKIINVLAKECEVRGTDATGIAYNSDGRLKIYKRPLAAHKMQFCVPNKADVIMGHTRMTTQGSEKRNYNNHPFPGAVADTEFALAHNGVLHNDVELRRTQNLPNTFIETDSYVAVQLIEKFGCLSPDALRETAEQVQGSFVFTVLDEHDNLYFVKGDNPLCIYHYPQTGVYIYASTEDILKKAIHKLHLRWEKPVRINIDEGDILIIESNGVRSREHFTMKRFSLPAHRFWWAYDYSWDRKDDSVDDLYIEDLKFIAKGFGLDDEDIDILLAEGFCPEEIEEYLYSSVY